MRGQDDADSHASSHSMSSNSFYETNINSLMDYTPPSFSRRTLLGGHRQSLRRMTSSQNESQFSSASNNLNNESSNIIPQQGNNAEYEDILDAWEVVEGKIKWPHYRKMLLLIMLFLLILCSIIETITYMVNGKKSMVPYITFLDQFVVLSCVLFFFSLAKYINFLKLKKLEQQEYHNNIPFRSSFLSTPVIRDRVVHDDFSNNANSGSAFLHANNNDTLTNQAFHSESEILINNTMTTNTTYNHNPSDAHSRLRRVYHWHEFDRKTHSLFLSTAFCDTISLYINLLASNKIGGSLRLILQQLSIPLSMVFSFLILGRVFTPQHVAGASVVVLGVLLCLINVLRGSPGQESDPAWSVLFIASCFPLALGGCIKEWILVTNRCDANSLNAHVSLYQLLLGVCLVPLGIHIQNKNVGTEIGFDQILDNFWSGFKCGCLGITTYDSFGNPKYGQDHCSESVISTWLYVITVCAFNLFMMWVIREGTAVLFFVASGCTIPIISLLSTTSLYSWLGLSPEKFTWFQIFGLFLTVGGCLYFGSAMIKHSENKMQANILNSMRQNAHSSNFISSPSSGNNHRSGEFNNNAQLNNSRRSSNSFDASSNRPNYDNYNLR